MCMLKNNKITMPINVMNDEWWQTKIVTSTFVHRMWTIHKNITTEVGIQG